MTNASTAIDIAILCDPDTHRAALAPFADLARLSQRLTAELAGATEVPVVQVHLLYDASLAEPPIHGSRPISFARAEDLYPVVIMPAGDDPAELADWVDSARTAWLMRQHAAGAWIGGLGSGVLALVAAGLLNEGPASIPPRHSGLIRARYPHVRLAHVGALAENGRVITAAEPSSVFAFAVALTSRFHSHGLAERYRRACAVGEVTILGDALLPMRNNQDILVAETRAWIIAHMHDDIDTPGIAKHFHVSARTLSRRFERSTGTTPARFLREVRLDAARSMLHRTSFSVEQIAHLVGYRDVGFFRELFRNSTGRSPRTYRMAAQNKSG